MRPIIICYKGTEIQIHWYEFLYWKLQGCRFLEWLFPTQVKKMKKSMPGWSIIDYIKY